MPPPTGTLSDRISDQLDALAPGPLAIAVSGGGDSMALMSLVAECDAANDRARHVVTVDHGLRPESSAEADKVRLAANALGFQHSILRWEGWDGSGNLQDQARRARRSLIAKWAAEQGIKAVLLAHTADDQAETLLMRLARGSGVYGLSAMGPVEIVEGITWARPVLSVTRAELRDHLKARGMSWIEDPSNRDDRFDRIKVRAALPDLADLGLTVERLAATADALRRASAVISVAVASLAREAVEVHAAGFLRVHRETCRDAQPELRLRLLAESLRWVAAADYTPRLASVEALDAWAFTAELPAQRTLHGCLVVQEKDHILICRELAWVAPPVPAGQVWDGRWQTSSDFKGLTVSALGEADLATLPEWRDTGVPRAALAASPAFRGPDGGLIATPFAMPAKGCHVALKGGPEGFFAGLIRR